MAVRDHMAADRYAMNLPVCPRCFTYAAGDEPDCRDCGCRLYLEDYERPRPHSRQGCAAGAEEVEA